MEEGNGPTKRLATCPYNHSVFSHACMHASQLVYVITIVIDIRDYQVCLYTGLETARVSNRSTCNTNMVVHSVL